MFRVVPPETQETQETHRRKAFLFSALKPTLIIGHHPRRGSASSSPVSSPRVLRLFLSYKTFFQAVHFRSRILSLRISRSRSVIFFFKFLILRVAVPALVETNDEVAKCLISFSLTGSQGFDLTVSSLDLFVGSLDLIFRGNLSVDEDVDLLIHGAMAGAPLLVVSHLCVNEGLYILSKLFAIVTPFSHEHFQYPFRACDPLLQCQFQISFLSSEVKVGSDNRTAIVTGQLQS